MLPATPTTQAARVLSRREGWTMKPTGNSQSIFEIGAEMGQAVYIVPETNGADCGDCGEATTGNATPAHIRIWV